MIRWYCRRCHSSNNDITTKYAKTSHESLLASVITAELFCHDLKLGNISLSYTNIYLHNPPHTSPPLIPSKRPMASYPKEAIASHLSTTSTLTTSHPASTTPIRHNVSYQGELSAVYSSPPLAAGASKTTTYINKRMTIDVPRTFSRVIFSQSRLSSSRVSGADCPSYMSLGGLSPMLQDLIRNAVSCALPSRTGDTPVDSQPIDRNPNNNHMLQAQPSFEEDDILMNFNSPTIDNSHNNDSDVDDYPPQQIYFYNIVNASSPLLNSNGKNKIVKLRGHQMIMPPTDEDKETPKYTDKDDDILSSFSRTMGQLLTLQKRIRINQYRYITDRQQQKENRKQNEYQEESPELVALLTAPFRIEEVVIPDSFRNLSNIEDCKREAANECGEYDIVEETEAPSCDSTASTLQFLRRKAEEITRILQYGTARPNGRDRISAEHTLNILLKLQSGMGRIGELSSGSVARVLEAMLTKGEVTTGLAVIAKWMHDSSIGVTSVDRFPIGDGDRISQPPLPSQQLAHQFSCNKKESRDYQDEGDHNIHIDTSSVPYYPLSHYRLPPHPGRECSLNRHGLCGRLLMAAALYAAKSYDEHRQLIVIDRKRSRVSTGERSVVDKSTINSTGNNSNMSDFEEYNDGDQFLLHLLNEWICNVPSLAKYRDDQVKHATSLEQTSPIGNSDSSLYSHTDPSIYDISSPHHNPRDLFAKYTLNAMNKRVLHEGRCGLENRSALLAPSDKVIVSLLVCMGALNGRDTLVGIQWRMALVADLLRLDHQSGSDPAQKSKIQQIDQLLGVYNTGVRREKDLLSVLNSSSIPVPLSSAVSGMPHIPSLISDSPSPSSYYSLALSSPIGSPLATVKIDLIREIRSVMNDAERLVVVVMESLFLREQRHNVSSSGVAGNPTKELIRHDAKQLVREVMGIILLSVVTAGGDTYTHDRHTSASTSGLPSNSLECLLVSYAKLSGGAGMRVATPSSPSGSTYPSANISHATQGLLLPHIVWPQLLTSLPSMQAARRMEELARERLLTGDRPRSSSKRTVDTVLPGSTHHSQDLQFNALVDEILLNSSTYDASQCPNGVTNISTKWASDDSQHLSSAPYHHRIIFPDAIYTDQLHLVALECISACGAMWSASTTSVNNTTMNLLGSGGGINGVWESKEAMGRRLVVGEDMYITGLYSVDTDPSVYNSTYEADSGDDNDIVNNIQCHQSLTKDHSRPSPQELEEKRNFLDSLLCAEEDEKSHHSKFGNIKALSALQWAAVLGVGHSPCVPPNDILDSKAGSVRIMNDRSHDNTTAYDTHRDNKPYNIYERSYHEPRAPRALAGPSFVSSKSKSSHHPTSPSSISMNSSIVTISRYNLDAAPQSPCSITGSHGYCPITTTAEQFRTPFYFARLFTRRENSVDIMDTTKTKSIEKASNYSYDLLRLSRDEDNELLSATSIHPPPINLRPYDIPFIISPVTSVDIYCHAKEVFLSYLRDKVGRWAYPTSRRQKRHTNDPSLTEMLLYPLKGTLNFNIYKRFWILQTMHGYNAGDLVGSYRVDMAPLVHAELQGFLAKRALVGLSKNKDAVSVMLSTACGATRGDDVILFGNSGYSKNDTKTKESSSSSLVHDVPSLNLPVLNFDGTVFDYLFDPSSRSRNFGVECLLDSYLWSPFCLPHSTTLDIDDTAPTAPAHGGWEASHCSPPQTQTATLWWSLFVTKKLWEREDTTNSNSLIRVKPIISVLELLYYGCLHREALVSLTLLRNSADDDTTTLYSHSALLYHFIGDGCGRHRDREYYTNWPCHTVTNPHSYAPSSLVVSQTVPTLRVFYKILAAVLLRLRSEDRGVTHGTDDHVNILSSPPSNKDSNPTALSYSILGDDVGIDGVEEDSIEFQLALSAVEDGVCEGYDYDETRSDNNTDTSSISSHEGDVDSNFDMNKVSDDRLEHVSDVDPNYIDERSEDRGNNDMGELSHVTQVNSSSTDEESLSQPSSSIVHKNNTKQNDTSDGTITSENYLLTSSVTALYSFLYRSQKADVHSHHSTEKVSSSASHQPLETVVLDVTPMWSLLSGVPVTAVLSDEFSGYSDEGTDVDLPTTPYPLAPINLVKLSTQTSSFQSTPFPTVLSLGKGRDCCSTHFAASLDALSMLLLSVKPNEVSGTFDFKEQSLKREAFVLEYCGHPSIMDCHEGWNLASDNRRSDIMTRIHCTQLSLHESDDQHNNIKSANNNSALSQKSICDVADILVGLGVNINSTIMEDGDDWCEINNAKQYTNDTVDDDTVSSTTSGIKIYIPVLGSSTGHYREPICDSSGVGSSSNNSLPSIHTYDKCLSALSQALQTHVSGRCVVYNISTPQVLCHAPQLHIFCAHQLLKLLVLHPKHITMIRNMLHSRNGKMNKSFLSLHEVFTYRSSNNNNKNNNTSNDISLPLLVRLSKRANLIINDTHLPQTTSSTSRTDKVTTLDGDGIEDESGTDHNSSQGVTIAYSSKSEIAALHDIFKRSGATNTDSFLSDYAYNEGGGTLIMEKKKMPHNTSRNRIGRDTVMRPHIDIDGGRYRGQRKSNSNVVGGTMARDVTDKNGSNNLFKFNT